MNYFKRDTEEASGNELTDSWGVSSFYFETDNEGSVTRQLELFKNGNALKYDSEYQEDKFGGISEGRLDIEEFEPYRIKADEFEQLWLTLEHKRFPEIIFTADTLWGRPRLDGRRLAVGDIVSLVDVNRSASLVANDYEITLQQVRQSLGYCSSLQCVKDKVLKYCKNCTLSIQQGDEADGHEQENWNRAKSLLKEFF